MKITWEDPGQTRILKQNEIDQTVEELKKHPGRWALISIGLSPSPIPWKKRGCECTTRGADDKNGRPVRKMYVRWPEQATTPAVKQEKQTVQGTERLASVSVEPTTRAKPSTPLRAGETTGACQICKKRGTLNAKGLCRIHAPLGENK